MVADMDIKLREEDVDKIALKVANKLMPVNNSQLDFQARKIEESIRKVVGEGLKDISNKVMVTDTKYCFDTTKYIDEQLFNLGCIRKNKKRARDTVKTNLFAIIGIDKYESLNAEKMMELEVAYGRPAVDVLCSLINECISDFKKNYDEFFYK